MKNSTKGNKIYWLSYCFRSSIVVFIFMIFHTTNAQENLITGIVTNDNMPLPGVNIFIEGTSTGTQTDFDGNFSINANKGETIVFSFIGMKTQTVIVENKNNLNINLEAESMGLEEVVVIGYGTKKKSDLISSVTTVKAKEMLKVVTSDVGEMLRGKAAGVQVTLDDGGPGSSSKILIRGQNSINGSNDPIVIADGVPVGSINDINPNDIASVEILKDAAAQAIYGARASNGVILITTKRGTIGKMSISYSGVVATQNINRNFDIYSGEEFAQLKREASRTSNLGVQLPDEDIFSTLELSSIQSGEYIDWEKEILRSGTTQNHNISLSSGTEKTKVFTSLNYFQQEGIVKNSDYNRVTTRFNIDQKISDWLKVGVNSSFQFSTGNRPNVGSVLISSITTSPLGQVYNEDGTFREEPSGFEENKNPLINLNETNTQDKGRNDILNVFMDISPFKGFNYRMNASRRSRNQNAQSYNSTQSISGISSGGLANGSATYMDDVEWQLENILSYKTDFSTQATHNLNLTAVHSISERERSEVRYNYEGIPNDILGFNGIEDANIITSNIVLPSLVDPNFGTYNRGLLSFVGRAQYDFDAKYYATVSARADASTVFGANNKWSFFPAAAIGWNVHKESFMQKIDAINNLKLRFSYGSVGNQAIPPYGSIGDASLNSYIINSNKVTGYVGDNQISNPDLKWETSTTFNAAVDFGLWNNRITTTAEFYNTRTQDLLYLRSLDATTGYSFQLDNIGEVENQGIEISFNTAIIRNKDLEVNLGLIFSRNRNKIISLNGEDLDGDGVEDDDLINGLFIGQPIDVYYGYKAVGIFQEGEDIISTHQPGAQPGDVKLFDRFADDGILNEDDRVITQRGPDWLGTMNLDIRYKNFDFSANINTVQGVIRDNPFLYGYTEGGSLRGIKNGIKQYYWTPEDPGGDFPRPNESDDPSNLITKGLQDASYIRLQNITLGCSIAEDQISSFGLTNLRIYLAGSNLWTSTNFESFSPEKEPNEYPEAISIAIGLQVGF